MPVAFSDEGWQEFKLYWARMKREQVDRTDLTSKRPAPDQIPGAQFYSIPFRNDSGETIPGYAAMRITGASSLGSIPVITVAKPSTAFQQMYLVNGPFQVSGTSGQNMFGLGTWADQSSYVLYDDANTPAYGEVWGPANGSWEITKYRYGFYILGGATGGTTDLVGCRQAIVNEFYGQTDGAHNKGSTGTISIFDGNNADTTDNMASVTNRYGNVATTKKVTVRNHGGTWGIVSAECP